MSSGLAPREDIQWMFGAKELELSLENLLPFVKYTTA